MKHALALMACVVGCGSPRPSATATASAPLECEVPAGQFEGSPLRYRRVHDDETDRAYVTAATPYPVLLVHSVGAFGEQRELELPRRPDTWCSADLRPKIARNRAAALRLGVSAALLDEAGIDFRKQSLVVFARPTEIKAVENQLMTRVSAIRPGCPGGRPPDPDTKRARRAVAAAPPTSPRYIFSPDLAVAFVIAKGAALPKLGFATMPADPCPY
jgi:hypothetical protein